MEKAMQQSGTETTIKKTKKPFLDYFQADWAKLIAFIAVITAIVVLALGTQANIIDRVIGFFDI